MRGFCATPDLGCMGTRVYCAQGSRIWHASWSNRVILIFFIIYRDELDALEVSTQIRA